MRYLRAAWKFSAFGLLSAGVYVVLTVVSPVAKLVRGESWSLRAWMFRFWSRWTARIINVHMETRGTPPVSPFFLVSNHLSYVDVILYASRLRCVFVARSDVVRWPIFGALCRLGNTLFIDRENKRDIPRVLGEIDRTMERGLGVIVFPEGTSSDGSSVLSFRPPLLEAAARARLPVSYASLTYETPGQEASAQNHVCWWGTTGFTEHLLKLFQLRRIDATIHFGAESIREGDRKILATKLWRAVVSQFRPVAS